MGEVVFGGAHYSVLFFLGVVLFVFTFVLNSVAAYSVRLLVRKMSGTAG
jgi:phosphate transport system permease protein